MDILLATFNSRYIHTSFGLRYLYANLQELQSQTEILEFTLQTSPHDAIEQILKKKPKIVGFSVYIWNTHLIREAAAILRKVAPEVKIVLGGPEISYETETQPHFHLCDHVICGEADLLFYDLCKKLLSNEVREAPIAKILKGELPDLNVLALPYIYYTDDDVKNRILAVEASRGCPFKCEYCLSSLDVSVRPFEWSLLSQELEKLYERGARQFKFIDRTFNLNPRICENILSFFYDLSLRDGIFLHFEMVPDRLPELVRTWIQKFPPGALQFEIGIQTWNPNVAKLVSRRQDYTKIIENFHFLTTQTGVHIHADLIVGLPGENLESFGVGFDRLAALNPHEIQVGILKRLKGTPIIRHQKEFEMEYADETPFQILKTKDISYEELQQMARFAKFLDLYSNSGKFPRSMALLKQSAVSRAAESEPSWFKTFFLFTLFLSERHGQTHSIALLNLVESLWIYATQILKQDSDAWKEALALDYTTPVKRDLPAYLRAPVVNEEARTEHSLKRQSEKRRVLPARQKQHLQ